MTVLGLDEFLGACEIPSAQRAYTGSDRAWTTLVNREQVQSLLKVVEDFVVGLRESDGLENRARDGEDATTVMHGVAPASLVTPANQKIFQSRLDSKHPKNQERNVKAVEKERHTDSSINTSPVLLPKEAGGHREQERRMEKEVLAVDNRMKSTSEDQVLMKKQLANSSQMAANEVSVSNTQDVIGTISEVAKGTQLKQPLGRDRQKPLDQVDQVKRRQLEDDRDGQQQFPSSTRKDIAYARLRLAQASNRRKSLEPPIGIDDADRMAGLRSNLESRKRPQIGLDTNATMTVGQDGIHGARQYLVSDGGESIGASIGSAAGNSNIMNIGRSRLGVVVDGKRRKSAGATEDVFDFSKLPVHLQKSLDLIKKRKLDASAQKKDKKRDIDLTGLRRMN